MKKNKILLLDRVYKLLKIRNVYPLYNYNRVEPIHQKQMQFHKCQKRNRWVFGGNRTGKTECGAVESIWLALGRHPYRQNRANVEGWVVSLSNRVQKEVAQAKILKYLPRSAIKDIVMVQGKKASPESGVIECISLYNDLGGTGRIWFKSCEEGREKFQGSSLDFVWFDEEPPEDIYRECKMRVLDRSGDIFGTMTPLKSFSFIYDEIYLNRSNDPEVFCLQMSWMDNPYLKQSEIDRLTLTMSDDELEARKFGHFTSISSGLVYPEFDENTNVIEPFNIDPDWQETLSIDPGLSNPLSCHWYARDYDGNIYVVAEHYAENHTVEWHADKIKEISKRLAWKTRNGGKIEALIDSAANQKTLSASKSVTELFFENGILVNPNVNKDILSGISKVKTYLKNAKGDRKLFIFSCCTNLIREIKSYRWGDGERPVKFDDHCLDELRYFVMSITSAPKKAPSSEIMKEKNRLIKRLKRM